MCFFRKRSGKELSKRWAEYDFFPFRAGVVSEEWNFNPADRIIAVSQYIKDPYGRYSKKNNLIFIYVWNKDIYFSKNNLSLHKPINSLYMAGVEKKLLEIYVKKIIGP